MHDIIGDILDWDKAHKVYLATEGATGDRYNQRLEAAEQIARVEARWRHLQAASTASVNGSRSTSRLSRTPHWWNQGRAVLARHRRSISLATQSGTG